MGVSVRGRRVYALVLGCALILMLAAALVPVSAKPYGSCGIAGLSYPYLGDPSADTDPPFIYAEYVACGEAARWPHLIITVSFAVAALSSALLVLRRLPRQTRMRP